MQELIESQVQNQNSSKKIENSNSCNRGPGGSVQEFWKFEEVDFLLWSQNIISFSWRVLPPCKSTKILNIQKQLFKGQNSAKHHQDFQTGNFSRICLTLKLISNSISSSILRIGLCMSPISKSKVYRPSWRTHCPILCNDEFILVNINYISVLPPWIQIWKGI
jgi:hypothetical protein